MNSKILQLKRLPSLIVRPIISNAPFIIGYILLCNIVTILHNTFNSIVLGQYLGASQQTVFAPMFIYFLQAYILAAILTVCHKRWLKVLFYVFIFVFFFLKTFLKEQFGMQINPLIVTVLAETNARESTEFIKTFVLGMPMLKTLVQTLVYVAIIALMEKGYTKLRLRERQPGRKWLAVMDIITIAMLAAGVGYSASYDRDITTLIKTNNVPDNSLLDQTFDPFTKSLYVYRVVSAASTDMQKEVQITKDMTDTPSSAFNGDSLNVVLVIGESYIKAHSQLYGYPLATTPNMVKERNDGNLVAFSDVCSPYAHTTEVVRNMLCTNDIAKGEKWNDTPFVPTIFKRAGFRVFIWDNQLAFDKGIYDFTLSSFLYNDDLKKISYDQHNDQMYTYDGDLILSFQKTKKRYGVRNLIIFHLMGQHASFKERYPDTKENNRFTAKDVTTKKPWLNDDKRQEIAEYDNATLYNDRVMMEIFNMFRNSNTIVVYVPDHGEEVYDWRDSSGRDANGMCADLLKYQYEVPFIVWFSDRYKALHPDIISSLQSSSNRAFETDNTCQLLFHVAGVKTRYYMPDRDVASPQYVKPRRIVNDGIDYDAMRFGRR